MKPYSIATLADRWGCDPAVVRRMIRAGKIAVFRVGDLIRIRGEDVDTWERSAKITVSEGTEVSTQSSSKTRKEIDEFVRSARLIGALRKPGSLPSNVKPLRPLGD